MSYLRLNMKSEEIAQSVDIDVFLPSRNRWVNAKAPFKTLYFFPGYSASSRESITFMNMQKHAMMHGLAMVSVSGDRSFYVDQPDIQEMYSRYVGKELVELTRSLLPLSHRREDTFIGGISMGGYGALYNGMRYKETFSKIIMLSPALWYPGIGEDTMIPVIRDKVSHLIGDFKDLTMGAHAPIRQVDDAIEKGGDLPQLFLRCGKQDELVIGGNEAFLQDLKKRNINIDYQPEDGYHDLEFWSRMMKPAFDFLA